MKHFKFTIKISRSGGLTLVTYGSLDRETLKNTMGDKVKKMRSARPLVGAAVPIPGSTNCARRHPSELLFACCAALHTRTQQDLGQGPPTPKETKCIAALYGP